MTQNTDTSAGPPPTMTPPRPPLRRSTDDRVIGGVAGGLAQWLGIDPVIVRVVLVVLAVFGGSGLVLYAIGWLFIPDAGSAESEADRFIAKGARPGSTTRTVLIVIAAAVGTLVAISLLAAGPFHGWSSTSGAVLLLTAGGVVLWLILRQRPGQSVIQPNVEPSPPLSDAAAATIAVDQVVATPTVALPTDTSVGYAYGGYGDYPTASIPAPVVVAPAPRKPRSYLGLATLSVALLVMGALATVALSGLASIPVIVIASAGLAVLGIGMLIGTFFGHAKWLMWLAIPLLLVIVTIAALPPNLHLPRNITIGDEAWRPSTPADATGGYELTIGEALLDLRQLNVPAGTVANISAGVGIGTLNVLVPPGMSVHLTSRMGNGQIRVKGLPSKSGEQFTVTTDVPGGTSTGGPAVELTTNVGIGELEVSRA